MIETVSGKFIDLVNTNLDDLDIHDIAWSLSRQARYGGHTMSKVPYSVAQHTVAVSRYVEMAFTHGTSLHEVFGKYLTEKVAFAINNQLKNADLVAASDLQTVWQDVHPPMCKTFAFHGLMHDFAEAYLSDLPTPVKRLPGVYDAYRKYELALDAKIFEKFGLGYSLTNFPKNWLLGLSVVDWADKYALLIEAYHFMPSRGMNWGILLERPSLSMLYGFRRPVSNEQAYEELLVRYEELRPKMDIV